MTVPHQLLADAVLVIHAAVVLFNVGALVVIVVGNHWNWQWVNDWRFRILHLASIAYVVAEAWLGARCPLTTLEAWLRSRAGLPVYRESFIDHYLRRIMFYQAPEWVFTVAYTAFGLLVLLAWWRYPPRWTRKRSAH